MTKTKLSLLAAAIVFSAAGLDTTSASAAPSLSAEIYFRCATGYTFEVSGSSVHCKKPAWNETQPLANCPLGLYATVDRIGSKDMCAATNPISGEIDVEQACKSSDVVLGFTKKVVAGKDYCTKAHPAEIIAPSVAVAS